MQVTASNMLFETRKQMFKMRKPTDVLMKPEAIHIYSMKIPFVKSEKKKRKCSVLPALNLHFSWNFHIFSPWESWCLSPSFLIFWAKAAAASKPKMEAVCGDTGEIFGGYLISSYFFQKWKSYVYPMNSKIFHFSWLYIHISRSGGCLSHDGDPPSPLWLFQ